MLNQFSSVAQMCPTLCDPTDCTPGFPEPGKIAKHSPSLRSKPGAMDSSFFFFFKFLHISILASCPETGLFGTVVHSLTRVRLFAAPWTAAHLASLSFTISRSLLKLMSIEWVVLANHLILCCPLLLLHSIFISIKVLSSESALCTRWPKQWSFSFSISPSNEYSGLIFFKID